MKQGTTEVTEAQQEASWTYQIANMTDDDIGMRDLLSSLGTQTTEILLFRRLLAEEYTNRIQLAHIKKHGHCL